VGYSMSHGQEGDELTFAQAHAGMLCLLSGLSEQSSLCGCSSWPQQWAGAYMNRSGDLRSSLFVMSYSGFQLFAGFKSHFASLSYSHAIRTERAGVWGSEKSVNTRWLKYQEAIGGVE
jgi:hypothetical protein